MAETLTPAKRVEFFNIYRSLRPSRRKESNIQNSLVRKTCVATN